MNNKFDMKIIGKRIKDLREKNGMSQEELAKILQAPNRETVARWEIGSRDVKREYIIKIAETFNVTSDYLLGLSNAQSLDADIQTACKVTGLSEPTIKELKKISETLMQKTFESIILSREFKGLLFEIDSYCLKTVKKNILEHIIAEKYIEDNSIKELVNIEEKELFERGDCIFNSLEFWKNKEDCINHYQKFIEYKIKKYGEICYLDNELEKISDNDFCDYNEFLLSKQFKNFCDELLSEFDFKEQEIEDYYSSYLNANTLEERKNIIANRNKTLFI